MKVLFDSSVFVLALLENIAMSKTGIYRYAESLVNHMQALEDVEMTFFSSLDNRSKNLWVDRIKENQLFEGISLENCIHPLRTKINLLKDKMMSAAPLKRIMYKVICESYRVMINSSPMPSPASKRAADYDVFFSPYHPIPKDIAANQNMTCFTLVHDLIPLKFPQFFKINKRKFFDEIFKHSSARQFYITPSMATKQDIGEFYPEIDPDKIFVIPGAVDDETFYPVEDQTLIDQTLDQYDIQKPYLLSIATLEPRKNVLKLIEAYISILKSNPDFKYHLVLGGAMGWGLESLKDKVAPYQDKIHITGFLKNDDLAALYSGAELFLFPSLYEGFGFPPLEAMKCHLPVITSKRGAIPEVVQDAAYYVDPDSTEEIAKAILNLAGNQELRAQYIEKGKEQAARFTWEQTAQMTKQAIESSLLQVV